MDENFQKLLQKYVSFKSVSTDAAFESDVHACVEWLTEIFDAQGLETTILKSDKSNPVVVARYEVSPHAKTILIYGHYDVQPAEKDDGWEVTMFS